MKKEVCDIFWQCDAYQHNKYEAISPTGLLNPLMIPTTIWEDIAMDFIDGLPVVQGKSIILVVVDQLLKYGHFVALGHSYSAPSVA